MQKQGCWGRRGSIDVRLAASGLVLLCLAAGCRSTKTPVAAGSPLPSPRASATPSPAPQFQGTAKGIMVTLFGNHGQKIAEVSGDSAGLDPLGANQKLSVNSGKATLFRNGKPASVITANRLTADDKSRLLKAFGGVVVRSLEHSGTPTARADEVTWEHDKDRIHGKGNVKVTADTGWEIPAASFTGDTRLQKLDVQGDGTPATGRL